MSRLILLLAALFILSACSGSTDSMTAESARCVEAKKASAGAIAFSKSLQQQSPGFDLSEFYSDLFDEGKVDSTGLGILDSQQQSAQIVSDNARCFPVARVADARRELKLLDPVVQEATMRLVSSD